MRPKVHIMTRCVFGMVTVFAVMTLLSVILD